VAVVKRTQLKICILALLPKKYMGTKKACVIVAKNVKLGVVTIFKEIK
jgi:hypothetical protein